MNKPGIAVRSPLDGGRVGVLSFEFQGFAARGFGGTPKTTRQRRMLPKQFQFQVSSFKFSAPEQVRGSRRQQVEGQIEAEDWFVRL
jgi:hypothetical protein